MGKVKLTPEVEKIIDGVNRKAKPVSIFVCGSRVRGDYRSESDYEIGVVFTEKTKWHRTELNKLHQHPKISLFPFVDTQLINYMPDTPFPKAFFMREITQGGGQTVAGKQMVEGLKLPRHI